MMKIETGAYVLQFEDGGTRILKNGEVLYYNRRPMYAFVKTAFAITEFYDAPYEQTEETAGGQITAGGVLTTPNGSRLCFRDCYRAEGSGIRISRSLKILERLIPGTNS